MRTKFFKRATLEESKLETHQFCQSQCISFLLGKIFLSQFFKLGINHYLKELRVLVQNCGSSLFQKCLHFLSLEADNASSLSQKKKKSNRSFFFEIVLLKDLQFKNLEMANFLICEIVAKRLELR